MIIIDFETKSRCDLIKEGTANYVADPSTDIICLALYNLETEHKQIWYPTDGPLPEMMRYALEHADLIGAHYAEFDMGIYEYVAVGEYGFPSIELERWYCTSAQCRVNAIPAGLDDAARALDLPYRKDHRGKQLIKQLSIPQADGTFNLDPTLIKEMGEYCMTDVLVTVGVVRATRMMTQNEHADWLANLAINERGVKVDLELATLSLQYADAEAKEIAEKFLKLTDGVVERHTQNARIKKWLIEQLGEMHPLIDLMYVYKKGVRKTSLDKSIRRNMLLVIDEEQSVNPDIREAIQLLDDGNKSSVAKFKRMLDIADSEDHRIRGAFVYAGASQTLRYASRGLQLHNMKRDCFSAPETRSLITLMKQKALYTYTKRSDHSMMDTLSKLLRPALIPAEGNVFVVGDWSAIEGMVLPWLSNRPGGYKKLKRFEAGEDIYVSTAIDMGFADDAETATIRDRQIGKVAELALGFSGGKGAFKSMARNYDMSITDEEAQNNVDLWRRANGWAMDFARDLNEAATWAVKHPDTWIGAGLVQYIFNQGLMGGTLQCLLPGDHVIQYPKMRIEPQVTPWGDKKMGLASIKAGFKPKADATEWPRHKIWPGILVENVTQAFAAALLRHAIRQLDNVVAHVHDEIVLEVPKAYAEQSAERLKMVMETIPEWAKGLPLIAEPKIMERYGK